MRHAQSTFAIDAQIRSIAATQLGVITVDQARQCGADRNALARRRASGALIAIFREAMGLAPFATTPTQRVLAASLVVPGSVIAATNAMGHRSGKEQQVARWLTSARLMAWTRNLRVRVRNDQKSIEVDFGWRSVRLALEVSPFFTHGSREKQERDAERRRLLVANDWRVVEALDHDIATERAFARTTALLRALGAY